MHQTATEHARDLHCTVLRPDEVESWYKLGISYAGSRTPALQRDEFDQWYASGPQARRAEQFAAYHAGASAFYLGQIPEAAMMNPDAQYAAVTVRYHVYNNSGGERESTITMRRGKHWPRRLLHALEFVEQSPVGQLVLTDTPWDWTGEAPWV